MLTTGKLRFHGNIILDIDEDFFGVEKPVTLFTRVLKVYLHFVRENEGDFMP